MLRANKVLELLISLSRKSDKEDILVGNFGISAQEIADLLGADRANISRDLNRLVQDRKAIKILSRPVLFFDAKTLETALDIKINNFEIQSIHDFNLVRTFEEDQDFFCDVIGNNASLASSIKKAKASMIYPPMGLHTLLIGPTGVGKTMFAELMFKYAKAYGVLNTKSPMIIFNCAEYADNPQLLLGQLFGYKKGAFTGADADFEGLVSKANSGILFLDEVHRLPVEGQELLFTLMDRGEYRQMGSNTSETANVLILAATTEEPDSTFLKTFLRRIPMIIDIPSLEERTLQERFELIKLFFANEYNQLKQNIYVTSKVIKALLGYNASGNVGQLKADIKLLCAKAYLEYKVEQLDRVEVNSSLLSNDMYTSIVAIEKNKEFKLLKKYLSGNIYVFDEESALLENTNLLENEAFDIYDEINNRFNEVQKTNNINNITIKELLMKDVNVYIDRLVRNILPGEDASLDKLFKVVSPRIYYAVEKSLKYSETILNRKFSQKVYAALSLHIAALLEEKKQENRITDEQVKAAHENLAEYEVAKEVKNILEYELEITLPDREIILITLFLSIIDLKREESKIGLLVLAHGDGVAKHMAHVANSLMITNHVHALDMSLDEKVDVFFEKVLEKVKTINEGQGVLMLVDMGSLVKFGELITQKTNIPTRTLSMTSLPLLLEATRKTMMENVSIDMIHRDLEKIVPYIASITSQEMQNVTSKNLSIICTCISGEGAAVKLKNLIETTIPNIKEYGIDIITCNTQSFLNKNISGKKILAVVGATDLHLENTPYISTDQLFFDEGVSLLNKIITNELGIPSAQTTSNDKIAHSILKQTLTFLDAEKAEEILKKSFNNIMDHLDYGDVNQILTTYLLHGSIMIERCILNQTITHTSVNEMITKYSDLFEIVKSSMKEVERTFNCRIPNDELVYTMEIFINTL